VKSGRGARGTTAAATAAATEAVAKQQWRANGIVSSTNNGRKREALKNESQCEN